MTITGIIWIKLNDKCFITQQLRGIELMFISGVPILTKCPNILMMSSIPWKSGDITTGKVMRVDGSVHLAIKNEYCEDNSWV